MTPQNERALIVGYFLSKFDMEAYDALGCSSRTTAHEELAELLDAQTACSRPVADMDWRPHHEHVGQTGIAIRPDLYIAVGISGAIQHMAGISSSKCIVAINNDADAPVFETSDYGIVGDALKVLPALTEAIKEAKNK